MNHDNDRDRYQLYVILGVICFTLGYVIGRLGQQ